MHITIKPQHRQLIKDLQSALGGVTATDAVGFLIQRQGQVEINRLNDGVIHTSSQQLNVAPRNSQQEQTAFDTFEQLGI